MVKNKCEEMIRLVDLDNIETVLLIITPIYELVKINKNFGNCIWW